MLTEVTVFWIFCFSRVNSLPGFTTQNYNTDLDKCGKVHLTVSSLEETYLELNWVTKCDSMYDMVPDEIALYDKNPLDRNEEMPPRVSVLARRYPEGYYKTKVKFGSPWLPGNWEYQENMIQAEHGQHCFPYWIASLKRDMLIDVQCLRINPTWMFDNSHRIGKKRIGSVIIPGTHNSGSSKTATFLQSYVMNQDRNVWTQLVFGIRYLDLRVGYYGREGFYINHDVVRITRLEPVLREIRKFSELAPREIIVVDFHRFPYPSNFNANIHESLLKVLHYELHDLALYPSGLQIGSGPTFNEIWARNKSIIVCYNEKEVSAGHRWLWHPIEQFWGNKRDVGDLKDFLDTSIKQHKSVLNPLWALMAELTPQAFDVIFRTNNLRKLANNVNRHVTKWVRSEWSNSSVNIVATDYFLGNDVINVAIGNNIL
uniref:Phosphatidylinositol-specific phospholipase C X domain-containing protein n=2 Tax=Photinus pyralis TaxID=7054 RepID=A0A1Y1M5P8_PHOPY